MVDISLEVACTTVSTPVAEALAAFYAQLRSKQSQKHDVEGQPQDGLLPLSAKGKEGDADAAPD